MGTINPDLNNGLRDASSGTPMPTVKKSKGCNMTKDNINPDHYAIGGMQPWEYMKMKSSKDEFYGFLRLNALKYISRYGHKDNKLQEVKKAKWYIDKLIEELEVAEKKEQESKEAFNQGIVNIIKEKYPTIKIHERKI